MRNSTWQWLNSVIEVHGKMWKKILLEFWIARKYTKMLGPCLAEEGSDEKSYHFQALLCAIL